MEIFSALLAIIAVPATYFLTLALVGAIIENAKAMGICAVVFVILLIFAAVIAVP